MFSFAAIGPQTHSYPPNFRIPIFLILWIQRFNFWTEVENKATKLDQEPPRCKEAPGQSDPWGAVERAAQPLLPLQGPIRGLKTPPLEQLFLALESFTSDLKDEARMTSGKSEWPACARHCSDSNVTALLSVDDWPSDHECQAVIRRYPPLWLVANCLLWK